MPVIYLRHTVHGEKVAFATVEADADKANGWVEFDPTKGAAPAAPEVPVTPPDAPVVPAFLAPAPDAPVVPVVESDLPADFPGREELIAGGLTTWASVVDATRDQLLAVKGIGPKTADAILEKMAG